MENSKPKLPDISEEELKMPKGAVPTSKSNPAPVHGGIIILLIILLLGILGGLYVWFNYLTKNSYIPDITTTRPTLEENNEPESTTAEAVAETQQAVSTSDEVAAIEADLEATDLDSLDTELQAIDAELDALIDEL